MNAGSRSIPPARRIATPSLLAVMTLGMVRDPGESWLPAIFCAVLVWLVTWGLGFLRP